jgi:hypothetical protein
VADERDNGQRHERNAQETGQLEHDHVPAAMTEQERYPG